MNDPSTLTAAEARSLIEQTGLFREEDDPDDVFDFLQMTTASGHTVEPLFRYWSGEVCFTWSWPDNPGPPAVVNAFKGTDPLVCASSLEEFMQFLGAAYTPEDWTIYVDRKPQAMSIFAAIRQRVGPPTYAPFSDAHQAAMAKVPDLTGAFTAGDVYQYVDPTPYWAKGSLGQVYTLFEDGQKDLAIAKALGVVWTPSVNPSMRKAFAHYCMKRQAFDLAQMLFRREGDTWNALFAQYAVDPDAALVAAFSGPLAHPTLTIPLGVRSRPRLRDAYEDAQRPWESLVPQTGRPTDRLESLYGTIVRWTGFPRTSAHLLVEAAQLAVDLYCFDEARRLVGYVASGLLPTQVAQLQDAITAGLNAPPDDPITALLYKVQGAEDDDRGPLSCELGFRLVCAGRLDEATAHLENATMYVGSSFEHYSLLMDAAIQLDETGTLTHKTLTSVYNIAGQDGEPLPILPDVPAQSTATDSPDPPTPTDDVQTQASTPVSPQASSSTFADLRRRLITASTSERGPLEAELGLRMCLDGDLASAYEHLEEATIYVSRKTPYYNLLMDVAIKIEDEQPLSDVLLQSIRELVDRLAHTAPADETRSDSSDDTDRTWYALLGHLKSLMFSPGDRARAWRRYGRKFDTDLRDLDSIKQPTADERTALAQLVESLQRGR